MTDRFLRGSLLAVSLLFVVSCSSEKNKYFSGELTYNYTYESTLINADSIAQIRPHTGIFRYDNNNYQSQFINSKNDTLSYYYLSEHNIAVAHNKALDKWRCENYGIATDSILNYKVIETNEKVLGYNCKILEFNSRYAVNRYYLSTDLKLSRNIYKNHKAYNWQFYGNVAEGGLILKLEHRFNDHIMKGEVQSISFLNKEEKALRLDENKLKERCGL